MERYIHPCLSMAEKGFVNGFFEAIPLTITIGENGLKKDVGKLLKICFWLKKAGEQYTATQVFVKGQLQCTPN